MLPTLWFRNTWSWADGRPPDPSSKEVTRAKARASSQASHAELGRTIPLLRRRRPALLFTENETNDEAHLRQAQMQRPYVKDGIQRIYRAWPKRRRSTRSRPGTKAAAHYQLSVAPGETSDHSAASDCAEPRARKGDAGDPFGKQFDADPGGAAGRGG